MALPLIAGVAIAAAAGAGGGGIFGSVFGGGVDAERSRIEEIVKNYQNSMNKLHTNYENASSISDIINRDALYKKSGIGLDSTYISDLSQAFITPTQFNIYPVKEENAVL